MRTVSTSNYTEHIKLGDCICWVVIGILEGAVVCPRFNSLDCLHQISSALAGVMGLISFTVNNSRSLRLMPQVTSHCGAVTSRHMFPI